MEVIAPEGPAGLAFPGAGLAIVRGQAPQIALSTTGLMLAVEAVAGGGGGGGGGLGVGNSAPGGTGTTSSGSDHPGTYNGGEKEIDSTLNLDNAGAEQALAVVQALAVTVVSEIVETETGAMTEFSPVKLVLFLNLGR